MGKYCEGLDCAICDENEPCIYKKANELEERIDEDKQIILTYDNDLRRANTKLDRIKEYCNETMRVMNNDTGGNPYAQGRTVEASRILEIIGE